jgi:hypothetical protein
MHHHPFVDSLQVGKQSAGVSASTRGTTLSLHCFKTLEATGTLRRFNLNGAGARFELAVSGRRFSRIALLSADFFVTASPFRLFSATTGFSLFHRSRCAVVVLRILAQRKILLECFTGLPLGGKYIFDEDGCNGIETVSIRPVA